MRSIVGGWLLVVCAACGPGAHEGVDRIESSRAALDAGAGRENGSFLSHAYVTTQSYVDNVPTLLTKMHAYEVKNLYVNIGRFDSTGTIVDSYARLADFLAAVHAWEQDKGETFRVFAWLNGSFEGTDALDLDATTGAGTRSALKLECRRFLSTSIGGSHLATSPRVFDGCLFDLEPSGPYASATDDANFNDWKTLMQELRSDLNASGLGAKQLGVAAHRYGDGSKWKWPLRYFYYMARYVQQITVMTYNSSATSGTDYQAWMQAQTRDVLRAVSGEAYGDASHPPPTSGVKVWVGFPAYPENLPVHDASAEKVPYAAQGANAAIAGLEADSADESENFLGGATMYLTADGSDTSTYARFNYEWYWWQKFWLGRPLP